MPMLEVEVEELELALLLLQDSACSDAERDDMVLKTQGGHARLGERSQLEI